MMDREKQFIEFGGLLDAAQRKKLIEAIRKGLEGAPASSFPNDPALLPYTQRILSNQKLIRQAREHPEMIPEIMERIIDWLDRDVPRAEALSEGKFQSEWRLLEKYDRLPPEKFIQQLPQMEGHIRKNYSREAIDIQFYRDQVDQWVEFLAADKQYHARQQQLKKLKSLGLKLTLGGFATLGKNHKDIKKTLQEVGLAGRSLPEIIRYFQSLKAPQRPAIDGGTLRKKFFAEWRAALQKKDEDLKQGARDKSADQFLQQLLKDLAHYSEVKDALGPWTNCLGRGLDLSQGNWSRKQLDLLKEYAARLENDPTLKELADMLGRAQEVEVELEEEEIEEVEEFQVWKPAPHPEEVVGIRQTRTLSYLIPSELALLSIPETEDLFWKKYAEGKLFAYDLKGQLPEVAERSFVANRPKEKALAKGPFILCVDTSGSMHGMPEQVAKTLAFALTKRALQEDRKAFLISFSTGIQTIELTSIQNSLGPLVDFLLMSFHGGTDASPALREALRMLQQKDYARADVIMVSDFVMGQPHPAVLKGMETARQQKTQFYSVTVSGNGSAQAQGIFDHNWRYNYNEKNALRKLLKNVRAQFS